MRAGHACIADRGRPTPEDARVVRLHVRVRADHRSDAAVEPARERDLLARRLGVEVDDHDGRHEPRLVDEAVHHLPRRLGGVDEQLAEQVDHRDGHTVARLDDGHAASGKERPRVRGTDDALARVEVRADAVAAERVVAERDRVRARRKQLVGELAGDARAVGDVLAVDDAEVDVELLAQAGQPLLDREPAGRSEHICEEEDPQLRASAADGRTSIETWSPASFV